VGDALPIAGMGNGDTSLGDLQVEVRNGRATLAGTSTLAGSVIALDTALRNLVRSGLPLPAAVAAATSNPLAIIGQRDRGGSLSDSAHTSWNSTTTSRSCA
jgi:N-acetylglucosamine-6-phosphate deacetylase